MCRHLKTTVSTAHPAKGLCQVLEGWSYIDKKKSLAYPRISTLHFIIYYILYTLWSAHFISSQTTHYMPGGDAQKFVLFKMSAHILVKLYEIKCWWISQDGLYEICQSDKFLNLKSNTARIRLLVDLYRFITRENRINLSKQWWQLSYSRRVF